MATRPVARIAIAAALLLVAWRAVHVNTVLYADVNRPVTRAPAGAAPATAAAEALRANPADTRALLVLARESDQASDAAARIYASAIALAPVDRTVLHEAAAADLRNGRVAESVPRLEALVTHYLAERPAVFTVFGQMLASPAHRGLVEARAGTGPMWLGAFIAFACAQLDPLHFASLFMRRAAAGQASSEEVSCVTDRLRRAGQWGVAYQAWINSLPRARLVDVGNVFNGGFEHPASGVGFDWVVTESPAQAVEFAPAQGAAGTRALRVAYTGKRLDGAALRQYLALAPGRYELSGKVRMDGVESVRGIQWIVRCGMEARGPGIASSERFMGAGPWRGFAVAVTVPASCPGQVLSLEPAGMGEGATYVSGIAWFDELRLVRAR
jgi:hypothetical protein